jgi:hypothetical protein
MSTPDTRSTWKAGEHGRSEVGGDRDPQRGSTLGDAPAGFEREAEVVANIGRRGGAQSGFGFIESRPTPV